MTGPAQRMLLLPAQCNAAEAHGLALARQRNISSPGISRELCWGAAAVIASGQHCGGLGLGGGPVVLSWWRSQLNCTAVRLVRRANPVFFFAFFFFTATAWRRGEPFGRPLGRLGQSGAVEVRDITGRFLAAAILGSPWPCDGSRSEMPLVRICCSFVLLSRIPSGQFWPPPPDR